MFTCSPQEPGAETGAQETGAQETGAETGAQETGARRPEREETVFRPSLFLIFS